MSLRRLATAGLLVASVAGLVPGSAEAGHCRPILIFSGISAADQNGPKTNPGAGGCAFVNHEDENTNTNYFVPGATSLRVGVSADPAAGMNEDGTRKTGAVETGEVTLSYLDAAGELQTETVTLKLTYDPATPRWNSQHITVAGLLQEATASVLTQTGLTVSVTYRALGSE